MGGSQAARNPAMAESYLRQSSSSLRCCSARALAWSEVFLAIRVWAVLRALICAACDAMRALAWRSW